MWQGEAYRLNKLSARGNPPVAPRPSPSQAKNEPRVGWEVKQEEVQRISYAKPCTSSISIRKKWANQELFFLIHKWICRYSGTAARTNSVLLTRERSKKMTSSRVNSYTSITAAIN